MNGWKLVSVGEIYYPTNEYVNYYLCVLVDFGEDLLIKVGMCPSPIIKINENLIYETRQNNYCVSRLEGTKLVVKKIFFLINNLFVFFFS